MTNPQPGRDDRTFAIIGAAMEVHRVMRRGYLEAIYYEALALEFTLRDIPFVSQVPCSVEYKGQRLHAAYRLDFVCFGSVIVESEGEFGHNPSRLRAGLELPCSQRP